MNSKRLEEILNKVALAFTDVPEEKKLTYEQAKASILSLIRELVPEKDSTKVHPIEAGTWNECRDEMMENIKRLEEGNA